MNQIPAEPDDLQEVLLQQTILTQFGEFALQAGSLDEILTEACRLVGHGLGTDLAKVMEMDGDGEMLLVRAGVGWNAGVVGVVTVRLSDFTSEGHALKTGRPTASDDISKETRFNYPAFLVDHGVQAIANVLIPGGLGRPPFGILQVDSRTPHVFTSDDLNFLRSYANLIAAAVDRLRALEELHQRELRLHESEARLARAISAAGMGTWTWDASTEALKFFAGVEALQIPDPGSLTSLHLLQQSIHPEDWPAVAVVLDLTLQDESQGSLTTECRVILPDNTLRWLLMTGSVERPVSGVSTCISGFTRDVTQSRAAEERILHMARHDGLTGLLNRRALHERLEDALLRSKRGESCAILALDLNRFKDVNDTLGHAVGDAVLCSVAARLLEATRETDVVARPGGDEFIVIQFGLHQPDDVETLAIRIVAKLNQPYEIGGHEVVTGTSIGIAIAPSDGIELEQVLKCADLALYAAKHDDHVDIHFYKAGM